MGAILAKGIMFNISSSERATLAGRPHPATSPRRFLLTASLAAALLLSACGGGDAAANFNIGVVVGGQTVSTTRVESGGSLNVTVHAGDALSLDAGEPVIWTLYVGGSAVSGGALVIYAGVEITATTLSPSAVGIDTFAQYPLSAGVPVTLVATSTYDSAQVATVNLLITN